MVARCGQRWTNSALLSAAAGFLFLPGLYAQPAAKVIYETGQVSVLKDGYPIALEIGKTIQVKQTIVTGPDGYARFQLTDNTIWEVFSNSKVVFHDNFPSWTDWLFVQIGRVKIFEQHTKGEDSKKVTTPTAVISVRGTTYDIVVEDDDGTTFVTVDDGAVEVENRTYPGGQHVLLNPGDSIRVFRGQPLIARQVDHAAVMRVFLKAARDAMNVVLINRPGSVGMPGGVGGPGQGDPHPKSGGGTGSGTTNGAPAPPSGNGAPPPPSGAPSGGH